MAALNATYAWCPVPDGVHRRSRVVQEQLTVHTSTSMTAVIHT
ncbi:hypothetical protein [Streptomyces sp. HUAS ZL42]